MVGRFVLGIASALLIVACGSTAATPGPGQEEGSPVVRPMGESTSPTSETPWPTVEPPAEPSSPSAAASPESRPSASPTRGPVPTPGVTPQPTLPPIAQPWTFDGKIALNDPERWSWDASGVVLATGDVLLVDPYGRRAAIRDARTGRWRIVAGLPADRSAFGFVALPDGSALVVGGTNSHGVSYSSVYRFDAPTSAWQRLGALNWARSSPGVALLSDGRVLVAGGSYLNGRMVGAAGFVPVSVRAEDREGVRLADVEGPTPVTVPYATVEIFDPATGKSTMVRPLACARSDPGVTTLSDGRIMLADLMPEGCGAAEIYDPATGSFTKTGELPPLDAKDLAQLGIDPARPDAYFDYASLVGPIAIGDGGALLGLVQDQKHGFSLHRSFRFRPATNSWVQFGPSAIASWDWRTGLRDCTRSYSLRDGALVPLADGRLFVAGGSIPCLEEQDRWWVPVVATRIFDPVRNEWLAGADLPASMTATAALQLRDGSVLLVGQFGDDCCDSEQPLVAIRYVLEPGG